VTKDSIEESTMDFVLLSPDMMNDLEAIQIDDKREHVLTKLIKNKKVLRKLKVTIAQLYQSSGWDGVTNQRSQEKRYSI
jgi:hypothetical protein